MYILTQLSFIHITDYNIYVCVYISGEIERLFVAAALTKTNSLINIVDSEREVKYDLSR